MPPPDRLQEWLCIVTQRSLDQRRAWTAAACHCSIRSCLLRGSPSCLVLPNPTTPRSEMPPRGCPQAHVWCQLPLWPPGHCPAGGVRLLWCQALVARLLSARRGGGRWPRGPWVPKYLIPEAWNPLSCSWPGTLRQCFWLVKLLLDNDNSNSLDKTA